MYKSDRKPARVERTTIPFHRTQRASEAHEEQSAARDANDKPKSCMKSGQSTKSISFSEPKRDRIAKKNVEQESVEEKAECSCCRSVMEKIEGLSTQLSETQSIFNERFKRQEQILNELLMAKRKPGGTDSLLRIEDIESENELDSEAIESNEKIGRRSRNRLRELRSVHERRDQLEATYDSEMLAECRDVSYPTRLVQFNIDGRGSPVRSTSSNFISSEHFVAGVKNMNRDPIQELRPRLLAYGGDNKKRKRSPTL